MDKMFSAAMRRALDSVRGGDPEAATRQIRAALSGGVDGPDAAPENAAPGTGPRPRRPLSEVLAGLARRPAGLDARARPVPAPAPQTPAGALFERRHHSCAHGARDYLLYRPAGAGPVRGVVLMLHGCTQTPEDFARGTAMNTVAERHGLVVIYPEQTRGQNSSLCWNWFRPGDQTRRGGEPAILAGLAATVAAEHGVAPPAVFAAGLSAGGAMAAILAQAHPELFGAVGIHSGLAPGSARDVVSAFAAMRGDPAPGAVALAAPAIIFHGSADATVAPVNAGRLAGTLSDATRRSGTAAGRRFDVLEGRNAAGNPVEVWRIDGAGHTWSGGDAGASHTDPTGPDASAEMARFFLSRL